MTAAAAPLAEAVFSRGQQSWDFEQMFALCGETLRVRIRRDAYVHQSHAKVDIFDPAGRVWNELARIPAALAAVCQPANPGLHRVSYVHAAERLDRSAFHEDAAALLAQAATILGARS